MSEVELGFVSGIFGVQGEVRLHLHNRETDLFNRPVSVVLVGPDGERRTVSVKARPGAGKRIIGRIEGLNSRDGAAALKDWRIVIDREALPGVGKGEFYVTDVEGAPVFIDGAQVGVLRAVHTTGPVDLLEIEVEGEVQFVPAVEEFVVSIDPEAGRVELAPGALE